MHFRHILVKIQLKILKQYFDWGAGPPGYTLANFFGANLVRFGQKLSKFG